jgi:tripartite-type tricarboxylate transporter receptor subunit TctC
MSIKKVFFAVCLSVIGAAANAQTYPSKPVTIIVPFSAGGATDQSARLAAQVLTEVLGQPFIVENKLGAGGMIGLEQVARAAPDGYTLGWGGNSPMTISPYLHKKPAYDPATAFTPISIAGLSSFTLTARNGLGVASYEDLVRLARAKPGQVTFASTGIGTSTHMLGELLKSAAKVDMLHVPFKGESEGVVGLISGQVDVSWLSTQVAIPQVTAGKMRGLVVSGKSREPSLPNVPTASEVGAPDLSVDIFFGLIGPAKLPPEVVSTLANAMQKVARNQNYIRTLEKSGFRASSDTPAQFAQVLASERQRWSALIKQTRISAD